MELEQLINRPDFSLFQDIPLGNNWLELITCSFEMTPSWREADIALVGLDTQATDLVRSKLYPLKKGRSGDYRVVDLGNIPSNKVEHISLIVRELLNKNTLPICIGGKHEWMIYQLDAYHQNINLVNVDSKIDLERDNPELTHRHLASIFKSPQLKYFTHLAHQEYLTEREAIIFLQKANFELWSVGKMRDNFRAVEPLLREADLLSFDMCAIRQHDAPATNFPQAFGLTAQEACRLAWYAGSSPRLSSTAFYNFLPQHDIQHQTASVIATMIWYFVEGFYHRKPDFLKNTETFIKYIVPIQKSDASLVFYKSKVSDTWWMQLSAKKIIPCSYEDYLEATQGDLPDRWLKGQSRI